MEVLTWDPSFSVKVSRCDEHHKKVFALINALHEAIAAGKEADAVQRVVQELAQYTKYHFSAEEALMEKAGYAGLEAHRLKHQEFVRQVEQFQEDLLMGGSGNADVLIGFLTDWLTRHIKQTDQKYAEPLNAKGIK